MVASPNPAIRVECAPALVEEFELPGLADEQRSLYTGGTTAAWPFWVLILSHIVIDFFPIFIPALMIALKADLGMAAWQEGVLYALGPIVSGLPQAIWAWSTDRFDTRLMGPIGMVLGATSICLIGFADSFWQLALLVCLGYLGTGMYHPIGAALAGQLGSRVLRGGRALAVSLFFAAGMLGHSIGPILATNINKSFGMPHLAWLIAPAVIIAVLLLASTRRVAHRHDNHREIHISISREELRIRWFMVAVLATQNALRFTVNIGMFVLLGLWAKMQISDNPDLGAVLHGNLLVAMTLGMGTSGLVAARIIRPGWEKKPFLWISLAGAIIVGATGFIGHALGTFPMYGATFLCGAAFGSLIPTTIALGQRLLPTNTGLVSSLLMGFGWAISASAYLWAALFTGGADLDSVVSLPPWRIDLGFVGFGAMMLLAGLLTLLLPGRILGKLGEFN